MPQNGIHIRPEAVIGIVQNKAGRKLQRCAAALAGLHQNARCGLAFARMDGEREHPTEAARERAENIGEGIRAVD